MLTVATDFLAAIPIFQGLSEQERSQLMQGMVREHYDAGAVLFQTGEIGQGLHVLIEGSVEVVLDVYSLENPMLDDPEGTPRAMDHAVVADLDAGGVFGEVSFFGGGEHTATIRAKTDIELWTLPAEEYGRMLAMGTIAAYKLGANAARILADRLRGADKTITDLILAQHDPLTRLEWAEQHLGLHQQHWSSAAID